MFDACSRDTKSEVSSMKEVVKESFHIIEKTAVGEIRGIETGFTRYDELTGGLHKGELIIIAARPGDGKTTLATNIVTNIAMNLNEPSLFFSLEMDKASLGIRALCAASSQSSLDIKPNGLSKDAFSKYLKAANLLQNLPIFIDDSAAQTVLKIKATLRKYKAQHNISLAVIDYLQLMKGGRNKDNSREQQVAEISRSLKIMAKELKIPIVALCQMNREIVKASRRPRLSDLRESGAIEQDADVVLFLHRPRTDDDEDNGPMEAILAKQRNGPTGIFRLAFLEEFNRFENYTDLTEWSNM
jgi:replicative DNA helicase